jgi:branched-chain amino acid transport system permease protein
MELLGQQVLAGIATGAIYACMALAVVMIYQAIDHLNFAQGEMAMFSTFIAYQLMLWGFPYGIAFLLTIVISFAGGVFIDRVIFKPIHDAPILSHVVVFIALLAILNSAAGFIWDFTVKSFPSPFGSSPLFGSSLISAHQAGMVCVTLLLLLFLFFFFRYTRIGLSMRAAAANPASARLVGVRVGWMNALGWGMAAAIGAIAGILIAPVVFLEPNMMQTVLLYAFAAAILGGLDSPVGAVVGGIILGLTIDLLGRYVGWIGSTLKLPVALLLILGFLLLRPAGLFGKLVVRRV